MYRTGAAIRTCLTASALIGGVLSMAACQQIGGEPRDAAAGFMASAKPAYGLHYTDTGEGVKLAYGLANSEVMSLMLECAKGSGAVEVSDVSQGARRLTLNSGGVRSDFNGTVEAAPMASVIVASGKSDAPALKAFRQSGRVEVVNGPLRYDVAASAPEKVMVEQFFAACARTA